MSDARDVRARILEALSLAEHPLSGSELGRRLMLSRTAIWKHVRALRREGFGIEAVPGRGYRLSDDVLTEAAIRAHLGVPRRIGRSIRVLAETGSTNTDVLAAATAGEDEGLALFARRQTAGRGRLGRRWHTLPKALAFSVLLRPPMHPAEASRLALLAAVAVHEALAAWAPGLGIKWPNDLLAGGRKLAGILTEMRAEPERVQAVAIGIGINLAPPPDGWPDDLRWPATDLETACGRPLPQAQVA
ncbi:MAG: biotin--[acetyl-CoA-carboxylase] ligase, partial [Deltaproteobacteria bacterium]